jgi:hypothetical protein
MIVFDLKCSDGHVFEAWFNSSSAFENQQQKGLVACPMCGDTEISKAVMAPNVAVKSNQRAATTQVPIAKAPELGPAEVKALLAKMAKVQSDMLAESKWVGRDFDRTARAMDAGEIDQTKIHGEVSPNEAEALVEDGIAVMPLPFRVTPPNKRN